MSQESKLCKALNVYMLIYKLAYMSLGTTRFYCLGDEKFSNCYITWRVDRDTER